MRRYLLLFGLTTVCFAQAVNPSAQQPPPAAAQQGPSTPSTPQPDPQTQAREKVISALRAKKYDEALAEAKTILASSPGNSQSNKLIGVVYLDMQKPAEALPYFERALELDANDPNVHSLLMQAYAATGDAKRRDEQRTILRGYHSDGKHPELARSAGYMIESIPVGEKIVQAFEFYQPYGSFRLYYRFNVFSTEGHLLSFITLESGDAGQIVYAKEHPKEAAAGERRFTLDRYRQNNTGQPVREEIGTIDGEPTYDDLRARVIKEVKEDTKPAMGTTVVTPGPSSSQP